MLRDSNSIIHTTVLELTYSNITAAKSCNQMIEKILGPEIELSLEKAVEKAVPQGVYLNFPRLEINIGTVQERELKDRLTVKMQESLEKALYGQMSEDIKKDANRSGNSLPGIQYPLLSAVGIYLLFGYLPAWLDPSLTLDRIWARVAIEHPGIFFTMIKRLGKKDEVVWRIVHQLKRDQVDEMIVGIDRQNGKWILEFRDLINEAVNKAIRKEYMNTPATELLEYLILKHFFGQTAPAFDREGFCQDVLRGIFNFNWLQQRYLTDYMRSSKLPTSLNQPIGIALRKMQDRTESLSTGEKHKFSNLKLLVRALNTQSYGPDSYFDFLKHQLRHIWKEGRKKKEFINALNDRGLLSVINLFREEKQGTGSDLAESLTEFMKSGKIVGVKATRREILKKMVVVTLDLDQKQLLDSLEAEEYLLLLLNALQPDLQSLKTSRSLTKLLQQQTGIASKKFDELLDYEIRVKGTSIKDREIPMSILRTGLADKSISDVWLFRKKSIVKHYLVKGYLPKIHFDLVLDDLRTMYSELRDKHSDLFKRVLGQNIDLQLLARRIHILDPETYASSLVDLIIIRYPILIDGLKELFNKISNIAKGNGSTYSIELSEIFPKTHKDHLRPALALLAEDQNLFNEVFLRIATNMEQKYPGVKQWSFNYLREQRLKEKKNYADKHDAVGKGEYWLAVLLFYSRHGFFPWWSDISTTAELVDGILVLAEADSEGFGDRLVQIESREGIIGLVQRRLDRSTALKFKGLLKQHPKIKAYWRPELEKSTIQSKEARAKDDLGRISEGADADFDIDYFIKYAPSSKKVLFRGLYHWNDDDILKRWLKSQKSITDQIKEYLDLAPHMVIQKISPIKWRGIVYKFSLEFYDRDFLQQKPDFHEGIMSYLTEQHVEVSWSDVFTSLIQSIRRDKELDHTSLPGRLGEFISADPEKSLNSRNLVTDFNESELNAETNIETVVNNAGMVLLWPFLSRFFTQLDLLEEGRFEELEKKNRAVYILQHLVFGRIDFGEHELVLNKVLTGYPIANTLVPINELQDRELMLSKSLLNGVLKNWDMVKNSSVEAIMETFLQRVGYLSFKEEHIVLKVEQRGVDVLLSSLPWSVSTIKLPWMNKPLMVEWY